MENRKGGGLIGRPLVVGLACILLSTALSVSATAGITAPAQIEMRDRASQPDTVEASSGDGPMRADRTPSAHFVTMGDQAQDTLRGPARPSFRMPLGRDGAICPRCVHSPSGLDAGMVAVVEAGSPQTSADATDADDPKTYGRSRALVVALQVVGLVGPLAALAVVALQMARGSTAARTRECEAATQEGHHEDEPSQPTRFVPMVWFIHLPLPERPRRDIERHALPGSRGRPTQRSHAWPLIPPPALATPR